MVRAGHEEEWNVNWGMQRGKDLEILRAGRSFTSERKSQCECSAKEENLAQLKNKCEDSMLTSKWEEKRKRCWGWTESNYTVWHKPRFKKKGFGLLKGKDLGSFICQRMSRSNLTVMGQSGCYEHNGKHEWKCLGLLQLSKQRRFVARTNWR